MEELLVDIVFITVRIHLTTAQFVGYQCAASNKNDMENGKYVQTHSIEILLEL